MGLAGRASGSWTQELASLSPKAREGGFAKTYDKAEASPRKCWPP